MPKRCSVPLCKGNYPTGPKVSTYKFPNDPELLKQWLSAIKRCDFVPTKHSRVCDSHFSNSCFEYETSAFDERTGKTLSVPLKYKRLKKNAVPTIFAGFRSYLLKKQPCERKSREAKEVEKFKETLLTAVEESKKDHDDYITGRKITSTEDVMSCVKKFGLESQWSVFQKVDSIFICAISFDDIPFIEASLKINSDLEPLACYCDINISQLLADKQFPRKISNFNEITNILDHLLTLKSPSNSNSLTSVIKLSTCLLSSVRNDENETILDFINEQLHLLLKQKNNYRYSPQLMIFSSLLYTVSPHAYKFLRGSNKIIIPHPSTLRKVCCNMAMSPLNETAENQFLMYAKNRFSDVQENEQTIVLLVDEIHLKPLYDYKGGEIVGAAVNSDMAATSAYVFMVSSILSSFKEVVHIMPVRTINANVLHDIIKAVVIGLETIGFLVVCVISDNNSINRKAMSFFANPAQLSFVYSHPFNNKRPLFFLINPVHIFKCIRNNWLNQKTQDKCFLYPDFLNSTKKLCTASFSSIINLYEIEQHSLVTFCNGLTFKCLHPANLERQNVKLVLKVFNKFVIEGLRKLGPEHNILHHQETAAFLDVICKWWDIFNVKSIEKGVHHRNPYAVPLTIYDCVESSNLTGPFSVGENSISFDISFDKCSDGNVCNLQIDFLYRFLDWLDEWEKSKSGKLTPDTHKALKQTTNGIIELCRYCAEELKISYILAGKFQTDALEERFGRYRQLAGSQYHISVRQLMECEKKLWIQSAVQFQLSLAKMNIELKSFEAPSEPFENFNFHCQDTPFIIDEDDIQNTVKYLEVVTYFCGYCCHSVLKKVKCEFCKSILTYDRKITLNDQYDLIKNLDRGGLLSPKEDIVTLVMYSYIIANKIQSMPGFVKLNNHRLYLFKLTCEYLEDNFLLPLEDSCQNGHLMQNLFSKIIWTSTNILLNFCRKENDRNVSHSNLKKRKLQTIL